MISWLFIDILFVSREFSLCRLIYADLDKLLSLVMLSLAYAIKHAEKVDMLPADTIGLLSDSVWRRLAYLEKFCWNSKMGTMKIGLTYARRPVY